MSDALVVGGRWETAEDTSMALTKLTPGGVPEQLILPGNIVVRNITHSICPHLVRRTVESLAGKEEQSAQAGAGQTGLATLPKICGSMVIAQPTGRHAATCWCAGAAAEHDDGAAGPQRGPRGCRHPGRAGGPEQAAADGGAQHPARGGALPLPRAHLRPVRPLTVSSLLSMEPQAHLNCCPPLALEMRSNS